MTNRTYADVLAALRDARDAKAKHDKKSDELTAKIKKLVQEAVAHPEAKIAPIARAAGFKSDSQVSQIAPARATRAAVAAAKRAGVIGSTTEAATESAEPRGVLPKKTRGGVAAKLAAAVGVPGAIEPPAPREQLQIGARVLPGITGEDVVRAEYGVASVRKVSPQRARMVAVASEDGTLYYKGKTVRLSVGAGRPGDWLLALPSDVERVYFTGARPWHTDRDTTAVEDTREWLAAPLPEGWTAGNHFPHAKNPCARFTSGPRTVELRHAGEWTGGDCDASPAHVWHAFRLLREGIKSRFEGKRGNTAAVELLGSPTTTGQDLWSRTIPHRTEYPVMSAELRELLLTTSGQGRFELLSATAGTPESDRLPGLYYYDGTFAYAALAWGLGAGVPERITGRQFAALDTTERAAAVRSRSRWHATVTVPHGWNHVGILPLSGEQGWEYPREPGRTFTTWAGGPELWLAMEHGWKVEVRDGIRWAEGKPLNLWREKLADLWTAMGSLASVHADPQWREVAKLAQKMVRSIVLHTIGGFASKGQARSGMVPIDSEHLIPRGSRVSRSDDGRSLLWENSERAAASGQYAHPEWAVEIWSRQRARLLAAPGGTGVLAGVLAGSPVLKLNEVLAFRNDAIFTTRELGWDNPEQLPGRYRLKGRISGAVDRPADVAELLALRDHAEAWL
ncbi:hypothetical protein ACFV4G_39620 [Kitasatospora sp. NPDC059747]|uniref:hypothetical protein n=1 Tax=Kitasatospora sp. NPDC059747 TaxID=3346930 RepID=UPI00365E415F